MFCFIFLITNNLKTEPENVINFSISILCVISGLTVRKLDLNGARRLKSSKKILLGQLIKNELK
jgi:hypothetical protein